MKVNAIVVFVSAVLILISVSTCSKYKHESSAYKELYLSDSQSYEEIKTQQGKIIVRQDVIQVDDKKVVKKLVREIDYLRKKKRIRTVVKTKTVFVMDTTYIPYKDTSYHTMWKDGIEVRYIIPPISFLDSNEYYKIRGTVMLGGIELHGLEVNNTSTLAIREKRSLMHLDKEIYINHSNPYIRTIGLNSASTTKNPTRLNKAIKIGLFIGAGYVIGKL